MISARSHARRDSVFATLDAVGDAWSWLILREAILHDVRRFNELRAHLGIARETLRARLDQLVAGGLLEHRPRPVPGSFAEYLLTECGRDFFICLATAQRWGRRWYPSDREREPAARHLHCGGRFEAVLSCSACNQPLEPRSVTVRLAPGARKEFRSSTPRGSTRNREPGLKLLERERACSIARTLQIIGDRWTGLTIRESFLGTRRFDDFERQMGIAPNILAQRLGRLVEAGVVARHPYQDRPLRHEYRLTKKGLDLYPVPLAMLTFGDRWLVAGRPTLLLSHRSCGRRFAAVLTCGRCAEPVRREDIAFPPVPLLRKTA